eukprot:scpid78289/ scgid5511/ U1 small nuclear ribonucleoprotein A
MRGQAFVVFREVRSATEAIRAMQGFPLFEKSMRIAYAKSKSDAIAKIEGTYVERPKVTKGEKRKAEEQAIQSRLAKKRMEAAAAQAPVMMMPPPHVVAQQAPVAMQQQQQQQGGLQLDDYSLVPCGQFSASSPSNASRAHLDMGLTGPSNASRAHPGMDLTAPPPPLLRSSLSGSSLGGSRSHAPQHLNSSPIAQLTHPDARHNQLRQPVATSPSQASHNQLMQGAFGGNDLAVTAAAAANRSLFSQPAQAASAASPMGLHLGLASGASPMNATSNVSRRGSPLAPGRLFSGQYQRLNSRIPDLPEVLQGSSNPQQSISQPRDHSQSHSLQQLHQLQQQYSASSTTRPVLSYQSNRLHHPVEAVDSEPRMQHHQQQQQQQWRQQQQQQQ